MSRAASDPPAGADLGLRHLQAEILLDMARIKNASEQRVAALLEERSLDVTPGQANVLLTLIQNRAPMTARQLAASNRVSEVTMGRFVRALAQGDWLERQRDPSDSRAILLQPTPKARAALRRFIAVSNQLQDEAFEGLDRETIERIGACTRRLLQNLAPDPRTHGI